MSKIQAWGHIWHFWDFLNDNKTRKLNSVISLKKNQNVQNVEKGRCSGLEFLFPKRERATSL